MKKMTVSAESRRVMYFVSVTETAKSRAAASATTCPTFNVSPGFTIISTPPKPTIRAAIFQPYMRSPRKAAARMAIHSGMVNSMAITSASGISSRAENQAYCPA